MGILKKKKSKQSPASLAGAILEEYVPVINPSGTISFYVKGDPKKAIVPVEGLDAAALSGKGGPIKRRRALNTLMMIKEAAELKDATKEGVTREPIAAIDDSNTEVTKTKVETPQTETEAPQTETEEEAAPSRRERREKRKQMKAGNAVSAGLFDVGFNGDSGNTLGEITSLVTFIKAMKERKRSKKGPKKVLYEDWVNEDPKKTLYGDWAD
jgi:hypothetical protein